MTTGNATRSMARSAELGARSLELMPGPHSNLPGYELFRPIWIERGSGAHLWDADGNEYLDYMCGLGAGTMGYGNKVVLNAVAEQLYRLPYLDAARRNPGEIALAEKIIAHVPSAEKVRYLLSGTEAVQLVLRLARAYTKRDLFIRFDGHYHGWLDNVFGGGVDPNPDGPPYALYRPEDLFNSKGRDVASEKQSFKLPWNDIGVLERTLEHYGDRVALIIMEPINANGGSCYPKPGYLERVRHLCDQYGIVLCFDEIITGFRVGLSGAQGLLGVTPDLTTLGKGVAGGTPLSVVCGKTEIMELCADRAVVGAGTFNGYPLGVAAGVATISYVEKDDGAFFKNMAMVQARLMAGLREVAHRRGQRMLIQDCPGVMMFYPADLDRAWTIGDWYGIADHARGERIRSLLFERGVLTLFRGRWFFSGAHTTQDVDRTLEILDGVMADL